MTRAQTQQALRQLPVKWALALLALIVVYALAQPTLNSRFGWGLPSLARLMGEPEPKPTKVDTPPNSEDSQTKESKSKKAPPKESKKNVAAETEDDASNVPEPSANATAAADKSPSQSPSQSKATTQSTKSATKPSASKPSGTSSPKTNADAAAGNDSQLLYGILKETSRDRYVSVEGLQYNPGSEEGHRLKHLERHLKDIPDRPGKHGVFDGEMPDALKWIDDAYARGKRGAKGVRKTQEDGRTIYEVPFTQPIGYIGGRDGKRDGNPPARRLRLVVEGTRFITAFPF